MFSFKLPADRGHGKFAVVWAPLSAGVLALDFFFGPVIQFPALFVVPVSAAAWYASRQWGLALAVALPLIRLYFTTILETPWSFEEAAINAAMRIAVLSFAAMLVDRVAWQETALKRRVQLLETALPLCTTCKRIRDEADSWQSIEYYVMARRKPSSSDSTCADCTARLLASSRQAGSFDRR